MKNKNILLILVIILLIFAMIFILNAENNLDKNTNNLTKNAVTNKYRDEFLTNNIDENKSNDVFEKTNSVIEDKSNIVLPINKTEINNSETNLNNTENSFIDLNVGKTENITGGQLIYVNDYELIINQKLIDVGYTIAVENNVLTINAKDDSYKCVMVQLTDEYVMPTEEEIDAFYETEEYKQWYEEEYDFDDDNARNMHYEKYDEIYTKYYKNLGYTSKNSPDYVLTDKELKKIVENYILDGEYSSRGSNGIFPGYEYYEYYDWGKTTLYTIPKYYKDKTFGENKSSFSACLYFFEYYEEDKDYSVSLWTI